MSIVRVKPGLGIWVKCNGSDTENCDEKRFTANIVPKHNRAHWKKEEGWGRGARSRTKSWDLCPKHLQHDQDLAAKAKEEKAAKKAAKLAALANPKPRKPRRTKGSASTASPSAECAPVTA